MFDFLYLLSFFPRIDALYVQANLNIEKTFYMCLLRKLFMLQIMCILLFSSALQQQTKFKRGNIFLDSVTAIKTRLFAKCGRERERLRNIVRQTNWRRNQKLLIFLTPTSCVILNSSLSRPANRNKAPSKNKLFEMNSLKSRKLSDYVRSPVMFRWIKAYVNFTITVVFQMNRN